jgi:hypothetical protein
MNAFTLPAKGIQLREKSRKQMIQNMKRVNMDEPACAKTDLVKSWKLAKAAI